MTVDYARAERISLWTLAAVGLLGVNGVFVWSLLHRPNALGEALANPLAAAFVVEALLLVAVLAWIFRRHRLTRLGWGWFVLLSLVGSLAFAIPVALLYPPREGRAGSGPP